jgi:periplasmic protein TonB
MSTYAHPAPLQQKIGGGFVGAVLLHVAVAGALIGLAFLHPSHSDIWGDKTASTGSIQASMVSSIPLPSKAPPVEKSVLAPENVTKAAAPPPKEHTVAPPKPTDILIKSNTKPPTKVAPKETPAPPKHPQLTPDTPKAASGEQATQIAQSATPVKNGTASAAVEDKAFGLRYAYYRDVVSRKVAENWYNSEADPRASQDKHVNIRIEILRDGSITNIQMQQRSGSPTLDQSALRALQRIDTFGPLPAGDHVTVELTFDYHQP